MPVTVADLETRVLDRLEEQNPPIFWSLPFEIRPLIVEALNEATLISGEPQQRSAAPTTLAAATTLFAVPGIFIALLRVELPGGAPLSKTSLWDLDRATPGWEAQAPAALPDYWFPLGLTKFGIVPQLTAPIDVTLTGVALPVAMVRDYTGAEVVPFQTEYLEGFEEYALHCARLKEGGMDFLASTRSYDRFLSRVGELARFAIDKDMLRFTRAVGGPAKVTDTIEGS